MDQDAPERRKARRRLSGYQVLIHVMLVTLATTVVALTHQNQELRRSAPPEQARLEEGDTLTAFPAFDLEGREQRVDFAGSERESLVFVFTTVCPACRETQASWRTLYERSRERYDIVAISLNDIEATAEYRRANDLPFPVVIPDDIRGFAIAHEIDRVPLTALVDRKGKVRSSWLGVLDEDSLAQLDAYMASDH